jgi:hypothetical protein
MQAQQEALMKESVASDLQFDQSIEDNPKVRRCLRCKASFGSQWAGERICPRCKRSTAWQKGMPSRYRSSGG